MWWKDPAIELPIGGELVWCRRFWSGVPFKATYDAASQSFDCQNGQLLYWTYIEKWKDRVSSVDNTVILFWSTNNQVPKGWWAPPIGQIAAGSFLVGDATSGACVVMNGAGTLDRFVVVGDVAAGAAGESHTMYLNGVATALTCNATVGLTTCEDLTHSVAVVKGDLLSYGYDNASQGSWGYIECSLRLTPS